MQTPLGRQVAWPEHYDPALLVALERAPNRAALGLEGGTLPFGGADVWNAYELSWLDPRGKPVIATARFIFPCESPRLVESKSLKLYLGSFNQERLRDSAEVGERLHRDLSAAAGAEVGVIIQSMEDFQLYVPEPPAGTCLDLLDLDVAAYDLDPQLLGLDSEGRWVDETLYSDLFRSNCPVTGQPDWATLTICYQGQRIDHAALLRYLISFRNHCDFHENCVERIFLDIKGRCRPAALTVEANLLRRGGIDINPVRSTVELRNIEDFPRLLRQ